MSIAITCVIPASKKDAESQNLKDLIASIKAQDFPQDQIEILVITEGDSEQAKAIGIRKSIGDIVALFCADNKIIGEDLFKNVYSDFQSKPYLVGAYTKHYAYYPDDNSLNRYFSLIGANDPFMVALKKTDRKPYYDYEPGETYSILDFSPSYFGSISRLPSLGDNGFFVRREIITKADLDHYYPMDCFKDIILKGHTWFIRYSDRFIWHRTAENLFSFMVKRYLYVKKLFCERTDRRWKAIETPLEWCAVIGFSIRSVLIFPNLIFSVKQYGMIHPHDTAWFWHPVVSLSFTLIYGVLFIEWKLKQVLLYLHMAVKSHLNVA